MRRASRMVVWPRWCSMMPPVLRNRRWRVSGWLRRCRAGGGADGAGQDRQDDVEVDVERDRAGASASRLKDQIASARRCSMFIRRA